MVFCAVRSIVTPRNGKTRDELLVGRATEFSVSADDPIDATSMMNVLPSNFATVPSIKSNPL